VDRNLPEKIASVDLLRTPLSTGAYTTSVLVRLANGASAHDACPIGTTVGESEHNYGLARDLSELQLLLSDLLVGNDAADQRRIDGLIADHLIDTSPDHQVTSAAVAASLATARAAAISARRTLCEHIIALYGTTPRFPLLLSNMIGGGGHHTSQMQITELMLASAAPSISSNLTNAIECWMALKQRTHNTNVPLLGIEGCFVFPNMTDDEAIRLLLGVIDDLQLPSCSVGADLARLVSHDRVQQIMARHGSRISYLEDAAPQGRESYLAAMTHDYPATLWAADDLVCGSVVRLEAVVRERQANAVVVKLAHCGTLSRLSSFLAAARDLGLVTVASHRSQETGSDALAHIAVGFGFDYIKCGAPVRERIVNYSTLVALERHLARNA
jgi:enolase